MNTQKIGCRERVQRNCRSVNDCNFEFNNHNSQNLGAKQLVICTEAPAVNGGSRQQSFGHANSSAVCKGHLRSPTSALHAAERCMSFPQDAYKFGNPTLSPQFLIKNCDLQVPSIQSFGEGGSVGAPKSVDPSLQSKSTLQPSVKSYFNKTPCSKRQCVFHLKRLPQSDPFGHSNGWQPSIPLHQNHDLRACCGLNGSLLPSPRHPAKAAEFAPSRAVLLSKTRIRWTHLLHNRFVDCVNRLGGADKATPKAILKLMDSEGLTIFHVKSHLQKYRMAKMPESAEANSGDNIGVNHAAQIHLKVGMQLKEALQLHQDVQRGLHEQLEVQRTLQLRIEEQGRLLKMMLDEQHKTQKSPAGMKNSNVPSLDSPSS